MNHLGIFTKESGKICRTRLDPCPAYAGRNLVNPVPFHVRETKTVFEPLDFEEYSDHGFDQLLLHGPPEGVRQSEFLAEPLRCTTIPEFLQSWLFFSLIARVTSRNICVSDFVENDQRHVTTLRLFSLIREWQTAIETGTRHDHEFEAANQALDRACSFVSTWGNRLDPTWGVSDELWLSFAIIGETLTHAQQKLIPADPVSWWAKPRERTWGPSKFLLRVLQERGWCPNTTHMLYSNSGSLSALYFVALLEPPTVREYARHTVTDGRSHEQCTILFCKEHLVEDHRFPRHAEDSCLDRLVREPEAQKCRDVSVEKELDEILKRNSIPIVRVVKSGPPYRESIKIEELKTSVPMGGVQAQSDRTPPLFVAISHVWSDGMGNNKGNSLPLCRLNQIQSFVNDLYGDDEEQNVFFWLDTLCVPWKQEEPRWRAIRLINEVFIRADKVLVLDDDLHQFDSTNGIEPLVRINLAKWVRRLWTLPEGVACRHMYFRFKDGLTLSTQEIEERFKAADRNLHLPWVECSRFFSPLARSLYAPSAENLVANLWQAVQWRKSKRQEDETICLSTLLRCDPQFLLALPKEGDQRMCRFLSLLDETVGIPAGMVFLPGTKINTPGFRWANKTWMASVSREYPYPLWSLKDSPTYLTAQGLLMPCKSLSLSFNNIPSSVNFWAHTYDRGGSDRWLRITGAEEEHGGHDQQKQPTWPRAMDYSRVALILSQSIPQEHPEIALLVHISKERPGRRSVEVISRVWVSLVKSYNECEKLAKMQRWRSGDICIAEHIDDTRFFCIDGPFVDDVEHQQPHLNRTFAPPAGRYSTQESNWSHNGTITSIPLPPPALPTHIPSPR